MQPRVQLAAHNNAAEVAQQHVTMALLLLHILTPPSTCALLQCVCSVLRLQHQAVSVKRPLARAWQSGAREMHPTYAAFQSEVIRGHSARHSRFGMGPVTGITKNTEISCALKE
jgi:hypothetical protein